MNASVLHGSICLAAGRLGTGWRRGLGSHAEYADTHPVLPFSCALRHKSFVLIRFSCASDLGCCLGDMFFHLVAGEDEPQTQSRVPTALYIDFSVNFLVFCPTQT